MATKIDPFKVQQLAAYNYIDTIASYRAESCTYNRSETNFIYITIQFPHNKRGTELLNELEKFATDNHLFIKPDEAKNILVIRQPRII